MGCTDALRRDHEGVLQAAELATGIAVTLVQDRAVPPADLDALVDYARSFIEGVHHRREEEVLFPVVRHRLPHLASELDRLIADHARGRALMALVASGAGGREAQGDTLAEWARLVRAHTREEDHYLLPIVEASLSTEGCLRVKSGFARMERPGRERLLQPVLRRYLVPA